MLKEFKDFIATGSVVDLAVGVIMAGAVGAVTSSFVADIAMPLVGLLTGGTDFSKMGIELSPAVIEGAKEIKPANILGYGKVITAFLNLIVVGLVMFMVVKAYNKTKKPAEVIAAGPSEIDLLTEIRDALKK